AQEAPSRENAQGEEGERETADETADLLGELHLVHSLLPRRPLELRDVGEPGDDARHVLERSEGGAVATCEENRRDDGRAPQMRREELGDARAREEALVPLLLP